MRLQYLFALTIIAALASCASPVPEPIRTKPALMVSPAEVRASPEPFIGDQVRWGGTIVNVTNLETETQFEIVARELDNEGRPQLSDRSGGRFIAVVAGFLDPAIYSPNREITVVGNVRGVTRKAIDQYSYRYPVVDVSTYYLWRPEPVYYGGPYYDPFWYYDPWWPYDPWPYGPYRYW